MTIPESLVSVVLVQGRLKLNWIAALISKFRLSVAGLWRPRDFFFFPNAQFSFWTIVFCTFL